MQNVQATLSPFNLHRKTIPVPAGLSIQQMIDYLNPQSINGVEFVVTINGEQIPFMMWSAIKPKPNALVGINILAPGKGGGKNPLVTILSIALLVAVPYFAPALGTSIGLGVLGNGVLTTAQSTFFISAVKIGMGVIGYLATSALTKTPNQQTAQTQIAESRTQFVEGASNDLLKYGVVPINLGTNRMFPPQAALPYTETAGNLQFSRQLFTWGFGKVSLTNLQIGETSISDYNDVTLSHRLDADLNLGTDVYTNDIFQEGQNATLTFATGYVVRTTQEDVDEVSFDITFGGGLLNYNAQGNKTNATVNFEVSYAPAGTGSWTGTHTVTATGAQSEALRIFDHIIFGSRDQYDIRIKRTTADAVLDTQRDVAIWTALRSITYTDPVVQENVSGTGMRIRGNDQLNGLVNRFNAIVSTLMLDYDLDTDTWIEGVSSNPASIYRYVLQSDAFVKALADDRIDLEMLQEWHGYCESKGLTYNRIIDYETSINDVLNDISAAGMATPHNIDGIYSVIIDNERPEIRGMINPRNMSGYKGNINYPEIPHALRVEFRNKNKGYATDEVIVYADGYDSGNATLYERLSFLSCTNSDLAWYYGRMYLATAILQPETHKWTMDFEHQTFNRGDLVSFINDVILVGIGQGRIKTLIPKPGDATKTIGFTIDETVTVPSTSVFGVRIRRSDATDFEYHLLTTVVGETSTFTFAAEINTADAPGITSLCSFVEDGEELELIITEIKMNSDQSASISAINYAPERFNATSGTIPPFESNITLQLDLLRPNAPILVGIQSDESVMTKNPDNSFTGRMVISLQNTNEASIATLVRYRRTGTTEWITPDILVLTPNKVILTALQDGSYYDIEIRYQRSFGSQLISDSLKLNNQIYTGASSNPSDVQNFKANITGENILLDWTKNPEIDISHYVLRYSSLFVDANYDGAQTVVETVYENRITLPYQGGTWFVKAVDFLGNESLTAAVIITYNANIVKNAVAELDEDPTFAGTHDNTEVDSSALQLIDTTLGFGYYYFATSVDLGAAFNCNLSAGIVAQGVDLSGAGDNNIFDMTDIFDTVDIFGIGTGAWEIELQYRVSQDGSTFSGWQQFVSGKVTGWIFEFRLKLISLKENISPFVSKLQVIVDMPDRIEREEDLSCSASTGLTISYSAPFKNNPSVAITIQDGATDDRLEYISKDSSGFHVKIYNATAVGYVDRVLDYISSGYGRVQT